ncbi:putative acetyl-CoA acetyltransferase [Babesia sp. Xinjiang]|uniref:putative acetyl-CoA acetyltransferase n=1 Tax=Babesia sp. Xinjiang TaxID=462227 RepID=UPI000A228990|nr:putative acetyl-CoA acetyltransferase [Babesia sp. Xinjiang]ORM40387.1 putative acetyl-CoA acetyltransferase [Babesia sp. Xinjiang]
MANIIGLARTPFAPILGSLSQESCVTLGTATIRGAISSGCIPVNSIDKVVLSQVFSGGAGPSPARQISNEAGLSDSTRCFQISQLCTSGLKAISITNDSITLGRSQLVAALGSESSSQAPYLLTRARVEGYGIGDGVLVDSLTSDGFAKIQMDLDGFVQAAKITKLDMMQYATESFRRTAACYSDGIMQNEIVPLIVKAKRMDRREGETWISHPQQKVTEDVLPKLFVPKQMPTSKIKTKSTISDGASCLFLCNDDFLRQMGTSPIARILDCCELTVDAASFPEALVQVVKEIRDKMNGKVDLYEILDQYAFLPLYVSKSLGIDHSRINVHGSSLSIGHPMGASGGRQMISMVTALRSRGLRYGCVAGVNTAGDAIAILVEAT